jgi:hypothetical protein
MNRLEGPFLGMLSEQPTKPLGKTSAILPVALSAIETHSPIRGLDGQSAKSGRDGVFGTDE